MAIVGFPLDKTEIAEGIEEFADLIGDGTGLPTHLLEEGRRLYVAMADGTAVPSWCDVRWSGDRIVAETTPRFDALIANLRAVRHGA